MSTSGWSSLEPTSPLEGSPVLAARIKNLRAAGAIAVVVLGLLLFWPTTASLIEQWRDNVRRTYTHGFLIVAITLWLLWRNRAAWSVVDIRPSVPAFFAVIVASLAWSITYGAGLRIVHQALLPLMIFGAFTACYGSAAARRNVVPFAFIYFAVPVWDALNPLLQSASTVAVRILLRTVGIPAYFSGNTFTLPAGSLEIAGGCSGLHFFIVATAIGVLYGELHRDSMRTRIKLVAFAAILAMSTNWLRIFIIAVAAHLTDMQHPLVSEEHYTFGWYMFAGTMVAFFVIVRRWPIQREQGTATVDTQSPASGAISWRGMALMLASLLVAPVWQRMHDNVVPAADLPQMLPAEMPEWTAETARSDDWSPVFAGADLTQRAAFSKSARTVESFAALYADQHQGKELIRYDNSVNGEALKVRRQASSADAGPWLEMEAVDRRGETWLLWYAYRLDEQWYDRSLLLQIHYGIRALTGAPLSAVLALRAACAGEDCSTARATLREFAGDAWPQSLSARHSPNGAQ
jgi:exosortase A